MFNDQQNLDLTAPLLKSHVKKNPRGYDYIEGWMAIAEANRIFGFEGWDRETVDMRQLGEPEQVNGNWRVAYHCRVRVTVRAGEVVIIRDGSGYGSGIGKDIRDVHESATKEAETDAMKRALMTFGNPFGLALYDKAKANVAEEPDGSQLFVAECLATIAKYGDAGMLMGYWNSDEQKKARRDFELDSTQVELLKQAVIKRRDAIMQQKAA